MFVQSAPSNTIRPDESRSSPAMHRRTVVFPAPEGPKRMVTEAASSMRIDASTCGPPSNCLAMSAISSKEPHLSVKPVHNGEDHERNDKQHRGSGRCRRVVQGLHLVIDVDREGSRHAGDIPTDHQDDSKFA